MLPAIGAGAIAKGALALSPALLSIFGRRGKPSPVDFRGIIERYRSLQPTGYTTPEDTAFGNEQFSRGAEVVGRKTGSARSAAAGRLAARGLSGSPAAERVMENIDQQESTDLTDLERNRTALMFGIRRGREGYQQNMNLQGMMGELAGARYNADRGDLERSGFFNSMLEFAPEVFDYFSGLGGKGGGFTPGKPEPVTGMPEQVA